MKKTVYFSAIISLLLTNIGIYAMETTVHFTLTNKSSQPIWISGDVDAIIFTGPIGNWDYKKKLSPGESFSIDIPNGIMELTITLIDPLNDKNISIYQQYCRYVTMPSANNKDKLLIWNHTGHSKEPLYPASTHHAMGLIKTKQPNNIDIKELQVKSRNNV